MTESDSDPPRPTRGEQIGGFLGCLALLIAVLLLIWLTLQGSARFHGGAGS